MEAPWSVLELETTGIDPRFDRVLDMAVVHMRWGGVTARWNTLVNPQRPLRPVVTRLTGLSDEDVNTSPSFPQVAHSLLERLGHRLVVAWQSEFDMGAALLERRHDSPT